MNAFAHFLRFRAGLHLRFVSPLNLKIIGTLAKAALCVSVYVGLHTVGVRACSMSDVYGFPPFFCFCFCVSSSLCVV